MNKNKTEIILFCQQKLLDGYNSVMGTLESYCHPFARNLSVIFDWVFRFDKQISSVKMSFFQLRLLATVNAYLPRNDFERVIHAFVTSRLDYCKSLYVGLDQSSLRRLQVVQNAAARLLTGKKRHDHISSVLASLHWLPVKFRIQFKVLLIVFKCLNGLAPSYLSKLLQPHTTVRALRSSNQLLLAGPRSRLST